MTTPTVPPSVAARTDDQKRLSTSAAYKPEVGVENGVCLTSFHKSVEVLP